jgi:hypothetical protein
LSTPYHFVNTLPCDFHVLPNVYALWSLEKNFPQLVPVVVIVEVVVVVLA